MHSNNNPDLSKICRLCLGELVDKFYIFKSEFCIPLRIMACTTLEVKESDNLPSAICKFCRIQLEKFYLFRKKCQISDVKLRKHVRYISSGKVSKVFSQSNDDDEDDYDEDFINSQKFIATFENEEKTLVKQNEENLVKCDKCTQTYDIEVKIPESNIKNKKLIENFINNRNDNCINIQNDVEVNNKSKTSLGKESERDGIVYVIQSECSETEYGNRQEVRIFVEEEDESFYSIENESTESKTQIVDENDDSTTFIDGSCILLDEEENSNKAFDEDSTDTKYERMVTEENKQSINEDEKNTRDTKIFENKDIKLFKCHICPQSFSRMFLLDKHLHLHKKGKSHICNICKKHFAAKSSLDRHSRIHNGEKPYKCDVCGKAFIQNEVLKRHRYLHLDKKPFECSHCSQAFIQKNLLQHHMTVKHSNKPIPKLFNCDICPKAFVHSSGLSRHLILHSGISYDCEHCSKKFTDKSALKRHTEIHSRKKLRLKYISDKTGQKLSE
ncbi:zinc finger protein 480-like [Condylostylus longicornis]|uniref:zinc finger protein 480-like n=1 Tax=Condylostylus longicornis TaxID=2530218 RepID=UPI00244DA1CE|nr:zinc finger protein 480-like [Condylostylus longicornis]